jgi:hypothetical protein
MIYMLHSEYIFLIYFQPNHYPYKLFCETYTYSYEKFDTGIPAIDQFDLTGPEHVPDRLNLAKTASNDAIDGAKQQFQEFNKNNPLTEALQCGTGKIRGGSPLIKVLELCR